MLNKAAEVNAATGLVGGIGAQGHFRGYPDVHEIHVIFVFVLNNPEMYLLILLEISRIFQI